MKYETMKDMDYIRNLENMELGINVDYSGHHYPWFYKQDKLNNETWMCYVCGGSTSGKNNVLSTADVYEHVSGHTELATLLSMYFDDA